MRQRLQPLVHSILVMALLTLTGCPFVFDRDHDDGDNFTYCDDTGCYSCHRGRCDAVTGADAGPPGSGQECRDDWDCLGGNDCVNERCTHSAFCTDSSDCAAGQACDSRSTCVVRGTECTADSGCSRGFCDERSGRCVASSTCSAGTCGPGWACDSRNRCVPEPCSSNGQCMTGCYCSGANCVETATCSKDADCASLGMVCDVARHTCQPASMPDPAPGGCRTDGDCTTAGETCCNGVCKDPRTADPNLTCTYDGECGSGDCRDGLCHNACNSTPDCGTGDVCIAAFCDKNPSPVGVCVFNQQCGDAQTCINGTCHLNCTSDAQCPNGADFCDAGICRPDWRIVTECALDSDCTGPGEQCVNAQCRTRCMQDVDCAACPDGPTCVLGYCQEVE